MEEAQFSEHDFEQFEALQNSGLLDSLYESLTLKERANALYRSLHPTIRRRIRALKRIHYSTLKLETQFYKDVANLERRYAKEHEKIYEQRRAIVSGEHDPTTEEADWYVGEDDTTNDGSIYPKSTSGDELGCLAGDGSRSSTRGVPGFWLTVMKHAPLIADMIRPPDLPALRHLIDLRISNLDSSEKPGFELQFEFEPNEYFTNQVLTKKYYVMYDLKEDNLLTYDGPEVQSCEGCKINWRPGRNLTLLTLSKVHKSKGGTEKQIVTKSTSTESFFQFFDPPKPSNAPKKTNPSLEQRLMEDHDIGQYLKERVIPRAVTYFTGEALDIETEPGDDDDFPDNFDDASDDEANLVGDS